MLKDKENLVKQLAIVFGNKKAKKLIKEIEEIKKDNPDQSYSFIFQEDGTLVALKKNMNEQIIEE